MKMELRVQDSVMTSSDDGTLTVSGYVNKTGELSNVLGSAKRFVEKIGKGVFNRAIDNSQRDIDFLAEHDSSKILASTRNDSLILREDENGLYMEATIAPTSWGNDAYTLIKSGIYRNMSFGFKVVKDNWKSIENGLYERTIEDLELFEVSVVKNPAYSQSTIAARGIDVIEDVEIPAELQEEEQAMDELRTLINELNVQLTNVVTELRTYKTESDDKEDEVDETVIEEENDEEERAEKSKKGKKPSKTDDKEEEDELETDDSKEKSDDSKEKTDEPEGKKEDSDDEKDESDDESDEDEDEKDSEEDKDKKKKQTKRSSDEALSDFKTRLLAMRQED